MPVTGKTATTQTVTHLPVVHQRAAEALRFLVMI